MELVEFPNSYAKTLAFRRILQMIWGEWHSSGVRSYIKGQKWEDTINKRFCMAFFLLACLTSPQIDAADVRFTFPESETWLREPSDLLCGQIVLAFDECTVKVIQESPVWIVTSSDPRIFPKRWRSAPFNAQAEMLQEHEVERSRNILNKAIEKYPYLVLKMNLGLICILHRLEFSEITASGTNSRRHVYIANRGLNRGFTDSWVEGTFHAEFSSILLRNFFRYFDKESWERVNQNSFKYGKSGVEAIKRNEGRKTFDASLHEEGFLYEYAKSTLENDFNSIAAQLFLGDVRYWQIVGQYPRIKEKTDLVIAFYHNIDPEFDESFFRSIAKGNGSQQSASAESNLKR